MKGGEAMLSVNEIIKEHADLFVLAEVAERDSDGVATNYKVIATSPDLSSLPTPADDAVIIPTFKQDDEGRYLVGDEWVSDVMPANLYARFFRIHYNFR